MFIADLLVALAFGLFIVWVVSLAFGTKGPWDSFLWFFVVVALFAWAGGAWLVPFGPRYMGIGWFPIMFMGFLAVLLLTAASPRKSRNPVALKPETESARESRIAVDVFFWLLLVCLLVFGTSRYIWYPRFS
jgi:hypothetical protein